MGIIPIPPLMPPPAPPPLLEGPKLKPLLLLRFALAGFFEVPEATLLLPVPEGFLGLLGFLKPPRVFFGLLSLSDVCAREGPCVSTWLTE